MARYLQRLVARAQGPRAAIVPFTGRPDTGPDDIVEVAPPPQSAVVPPQTTILQPVAPALAANESVSPVGPMPVRPVSSEPIVAPIAFVAPERRIDDVPRASVAEPRMRERESQLRPMSEPAQIEPLVQVVHDTRTETVIEKRTETIEQIVVKEPALLQVSPPPVDKVEPVQERVAVVKTPVERPIPVVRELAPAILPQPVAEPPAPPESAPSLVIGRLRVDVVAPERPAAQPRKSPRPRTRSASRRQADTSYSRSSFGLGQM